VCGALNDHEDKFVGNKVVMTKTSVGGPQCNAPGKTVMSNNEYYTSTGDVTECGKSLADWQAQSPSNELGSKVAKIPSDSTIVGWARDKLMVN